MTNITEIWQAAVKERGEKAFELFEERWNQKSLQPLYFKNNNEAINALNANMGFCLKPINELVKLDIERYGKWAYLIYTNVSSNRHLLDFIQQDANGVLPQRKLYANAPFNLEWARAGVGIMFDEINDILFYENHYPESELDNLKIVLSKSIRDKRYVIYAHNLRHPFPPVKELEL